MKTKIFAALLVAAIALPWTLSAKERKPREDQPPAPIGWVHFPEGAPDFSVSESDFQKATRPLARGSLLPVYKTKEKHGHHLAQVRALNLHTGSSELGWVEIDPERMDHPDSYPPDSELLGLLGTPYLDDFIAAHTDIARFLVRQTQGPPALFCYVFSRPLSMAKLVIFTLQQGKYLPGAALNIPTDEMQGAITSLEIRSLVGDGSDCVISEEPFHEQAQTSGSILRIRSVAGGQFQTLWEAPIHFQNLSQYNPKMQILQPPEQNIGAPGTVTTGEVTYRPGSNGQEPVWKGKVEFFAFGREKPVESVHIQKACPWNGRTFAPLR